MAWIESHQKLKDDPKMLAVAAVMGWSSFECIGRLHCFWWWCVDHCPDGDLRRFNDAVLSHAVALNPVEGRRFVEAMLEGCAGEGFLERAPYFRVRNWWRFIGRFLKTKYKDHPEKWQAIQRAYETHPVPDDPTDPATDPVTDPATRTTNQPNQPNPGRNARVRVDAPKLVVRSEEATAHGSASRQAMGMNQSDVDRALKVLALYPDRASKDGRVVVKDGQAQNVLAARIASNRGYPWEEHAELMRQNSTPRDAHTWAMTMPDPVALASLRRLKPQPKAKHQTEPAENMTDAERMGWNAD